MPNATTVARVLLARRLLGQRGMPPLPSRGSANRIPLPSDWSGIAVEIGRMRAMVRRGIGDPKVITLARAIVRACPSRDRACELARIFGVVKANVRFVEDPVGREVIATPERMSRMLARGLVAKARETMASDAFVLEGDCDEHAVLTASLAGALGFPIAFGTGGSGQRATVNGRNVPAFHHIWGEAGLSGQWVPLDTTGGKALGQTWQFRDFGRLRIA